MVVHSAGMKMVLDSEEDRRFLLEVLGKAQITGQAAGVMVHMIHKVQSAQLTDKVMKAEKQALEAKTPKK